MWKRSRVPLTPATWRPWHHHQGEGVANDFLTPPAPAPQHWLPPHSWVNEEKAPEQDCFSWNAKNQDGSRPKTQLIVETRNNSSSFHLMQISLVAWDSLCSSSPARWWFPSRPGTAFSSFPRWRARSSRTTMHSAAATVVDRVHLSDLLLACSQDCCWKALYTVNWTHHPNQTCACFKPKSNLLQGWGTLCMLPANGMIVSPSHFPLWKEETTFLLCGYHHTSKAGGLYLVWPFSLDVGNTCMKGMYSKTFTVPHISWNHVFFFVVQVVILSIMHFRKHVYKQHPLSNFKLRRFGMATLRCTGVVVVLSVVDSSIYPKLGFLHTYTTYLYINNPKYINISACGRMHNPPTTGTQWAPTFFAFLSKQVWDFWGPNCGTLPTFL